MTCWVLDNELCDDSSWVVWFDDDMFGRWGKTGAILKDAREEGFGGNEKARLLHLLTEHLKAKVVLTDEGESLCMNKTCPDFVDDAETRNSNQRRLVHLDTNEISKGNIPARRTSFLSRLIDRMGMDEGSRVFWMFDYIDEPIQKEAGREKDWAGPIQARMRIFAESLSEVWKGDPKRHRVAMVSRISLGTMVRRKGDTASSQVELVAGHLHYELERLGLREVKVECFATAPGSNAAGRIFDTIEMHFHENL